MCTTADHREQQASDLLQTAAAPEVRGRLLPYCRRLVGNDEGGRDLYAEAQLRAHDFIQRRGWAGNAHSPTEVRALLQRCIYSVHIDARRLAGREVRIDTTGGSVPTPNGFSTPLPWDSAAGPEHEAPDLAPLVTRVGQALQQFALPARIAFRLTVDGYSTRQIEGMTGWPKSSVALWVDHVRGSLARQLGALRQRLLA